MSQIDLDQVLRDTFVASAEQHATLVSTNDRAIGYAAETGVPLPRLVIAHQQTGGRGRGGNRWWTGSGNLAFSVLLRAAAAAGPRKKGTVSICAQPGTDGTLVAGRSGKWGPGTPWVPFSSLAALAVGVAVAEALAPLVPGQDVGIRWPNDVLAGGKKLSGVLIEVLPNRLHVVGIGVNVNSAAADAPPELRLEIATLRDLTGRTHDLTVVLTAILRRLEPLWVMAATAPAEVAARADALCLQRGRTITVRQGGDTITGRCVGIAADGSLRLETVAGPKSVYSGVVRCEE
jgi:BirA family biotin operon repressor/biotin-[acetyl-CoA-carboxylase] ligase